MVNKYGVSEAWLPKALAATPGGSQTGSKAPGKAGPLGGYPMFIKRCFGATAVDLDENKYLDFIAGLAAVGIGHATDVVQVAVRAALNDGAIFSLPSREEAIAAERLCAITGWAEQARFLKTGSEATEAAIRIARCATGRSRLLTVAAGYHSWHSWFQAVKPQHPGVPNEMAALITGIGYGDGAVLDQLERESNTSYAAVILEPAPTSGGGDATWLNRLRAWASKTGTILIFDEMVWGFRLATAGGTDYFKVTPDLATYGKALGNGIPIAAVVGRRDLMQYATMVSGTFGGDRLGLAAAIAVMDVHRSSNRIISMMWERGTQFMLGLREIGMNHSHVEFTVSGYPVHPIIAITAPGMETNLLMSVFVQELADSGVLWHPAGGNIMACMTDEEIRFTIKAVETAVNTIERRMTDGNLFTSLRGVPYAAAFARAHSGEPVAT